jgi:hypothetical protein
MIKKLTHAINKPFEHSAIREFLVTPLVGPTTHCPSDSN